MPGHAILNRIRNTTGIPSHGGFAARSSLQEDDPEALGTAVNLLSAEHDKQVTPVIECQPLIFVHLPTNVTRSATLSA